MQQLIQAISVFVSPQSKREQVQEADIYLKKLERTKESWPLSIQVLEYSNLEKDVYFLAAKILKSKMEYDFGQLTPDEQQGLPEKLLQIIKIHKESTRAVQGQLVDAFIFCYLHMYDRWPDLLEFIKSNFYADPLMQNYIFMIYEYLPDNVFSKTVVMDEDHRDKMIIFFKENLQKRLVEELNVIANNQSIDEQSKYKLLKIMSNWIDFKTNSSVLSVLQNHAVFNLALKSMNNEALQKYSATTIVAALRQLKDEKEQVQYKDLFLLIASYVFSYFGDCQRAYKEKDCDSVQNYALVFSKFGNRAISQFTDPNIQDETCQTFLNNMLELTGYDKIDHEEQMSEFWSNLLIRIIKQKDQNSKQTLVNRYSNLLQQLLNTSIIKTMYDEEIFGLFQEKSSREIDNMKEEYEVKNRQRFYMKELVNTISDLIGAEKVIEYCAIQIQNNNCLDGLGAEYSALKARQLESILSCLNEVVFKAKRKQSNQNEDSLDEDEGRNDEENDYREIFSEKSQNYIFEILANVLKHKQNWVKLNRTILNLVISSSDFLQLNLSVCGLTFDLIVTHLETPLIDDLALSGFEVLCKDCPNFVQKNYETFEQQVYHKMMFNFQIIAGISHAICASDEYITKYLIKLCSPYAQDIINYIGLPAEQQNDKDVINNLKLPLKAIKNIIQCVPENEKHGAFPHNILQEIFKSIWPVLKFIIENKSQYTSLIENIVSILKQFITKMSVDFDVFFVEFLEQVIVLYKATCQSGILYIVEKCVKLFSASSYHETFSPILLQAYEVLVETTLNLLQTYEDYVENPELVEDFYGFLGRFIKYYPRIFFSSSIQNGIKLQQKDAAKALFALMEMLYQILQPKNLNNLQNILPLIEQYRNLLVNQLTLQYNTLLFEQLSQVPNKDIREYIYDIFIAQIQTFGPQSINFFQPILQNVKEDVLTQKEKEKYYQILQSSQNMNDEIEGKLCDFFILIGDRFKKSYRRDN